jgi:hypothetical protein
MRGRIPSTAELWPREMTATLPTPAPERDRGLRRMMTWVFITLILVVGLAFLVVELMLRWFQVR